MALEAFIYYQPQEDGLPCLSWGLLSWVTVPYVLKGVQALRQCQVSCYLDESN